MGVPHQEEFMLIYLYNAANPSLWSTKVAASIHKTDLKFTIVLVCFPLRGRHRKELRILGIQRILFDVLITPEGERETECLPWGKKGAGTLITFKDEHLFSKSPSFHSHRKKDKGELRTQLSW